MSEPESNDLAWQAVLSDGAPVEEPTQTQPTREELIEVGARAIQPAYGASTIKKAALVVDAILARYTVTHKERSHE
jgi:hypothetical protein